MKILIIAYYFPPDNNMAKMASLRPKSWAKYWERMGNVEGEGSECNYWGAFGVLGAAVRSHRWREPWDETATGDSAMLLTSGIRM